MSKKEKNSLPNSTAASPAKYNQKKLYKESISPSSDSKQVKNSTSFSTNLFKIPEMKNYIHEVKENQYKFTCDYCTKQYKVRKEINVDSLRSHIFSEKHENAVPKQKQDQHKNLKTYYLEEDQKRRKVKSLQKATNQKEEKGYDEKRDYLHFVAFAMAEKYTFAQISRLGKFLKKLSSKKALSFLADASFDEEEISKISSDCFCPYYFDDLKKKLSSRPFSLSIDGSTICCENVLAMKVRYLDREENDDNKNMTEIKNKVVGIKTFKESSTGQTIYNILQEKLFSSPEILQNLVGVVHDRGSNLVGSDLGFVSLLKKIYHIYLI